MWLTILEIVAFMVAASILGVLLGWVLRGLLGNEQAEVSELRAQLRKMKKQHREANAQAAAPTPTKAEKAASSPVTTASLKTATQPKPAPKAVAGNVKNKPAKTEAKPSAKKAPVKAKPKAKTKAIPASKKPKAERDVEQAAAKKGVVDIISRVGKGESKDDLTKIHGIGPKFSSLLNEMDITSFQQIAKFRKADVKMVSAALGSFSDRIERDDWVAGAKKAIKEAKK